MRVRIVCPEHLEYEGEAAFVALPSTDGELGVLPGHANEICTLSKGYLHVSDTAMGTVDHEFAIIGGYAEITGDEVVVLAARACDMAAVKADEVRAEQQEFEDQLSNLRENDAHRAYLYNEITWCKLRLRA